MCDYINSQKALNDLCNDLSFSEIISLDTEFERRTTYHARLSLIQIFTKKHQVIIDALADIDLIPLNGILLNPDILKIFHAPREDFEIFYHLFKKLPINIFDIQTASNICNFGNSQSYAKICNNILGIAIDKSQQKSDWLKRPVSADMLNYAIIDVKYLEDIYAILNNMMKNLNLISRYDQQILKLLNQRNYDHNIFEAWKKVKFQIRSQSFTNKMQIIAAYREETSMKLNIPRRHFISDRDLVKLCQFLPTNDQDLLKIQLGHLRGINPKYKTELFNLCIGLNEYDEDTRN